MIPIKVRVESKLQRTPRVMQLEGMFDVPPRDVLRHEWNGELPIDEREWNVGLIVGPSGAGKSTIARQLFGAPVEDTWGKGAVVDDFAKTLSIQDVSDACSAVGFDTIPSWMKPYHVLSTGEQFRVRIARALLERKDLIVMDEFTSVVDRQVAKIGSHAVQKFIRKHKRQFIAVTCHYDVIEWLQPDWIFEPATMTFQWRSVQRRPPLGVEIARVDHRAWRLFAPFHYLTADLHKAAACFVLFVEGVPASFGGVLHRPHSKVDDIKGLSRLVTLPDYQGLGLAMVLADKLGETYKAAGYRFHTYPAHPALVRAFDKSPCWVMKKKPGVFSPSLGETSSLVNTPSRRSERAAKYRANAMASHQPGENALEQKKWMMGSRPCAVFEYCGEAKMLRQAARELIAGMHEADMASSG